VQIKKKEGKMMTWHTPANQGAVGDDMFVGCGCCHALVGGMEDA
jgi:hypothetical protein